MRCAANDYENISFLGPFFRISTFPQDCPSLAEHYFSNPMARTMNDVMGSCATLRSALYGLHNLLHELSLTLLRSGAEVKSGFLDEIAYVLSMNSKRAQLHVDRATVSTDGFSNNICATLLRLAEPFVMGDQSKVGHFEIDEGKVSLRLVNFMFFQISLIDPLYFQKNYSRIDFSKETRMQPLSDPNKNPLLEKISSSSESANFVTECFFLTMYGLHVGFAPITANYVSLMKELHELQKAYKQLLEVSSQEVTVRIGQIGFRHGIPDFRC